MAVAGLLAQYMSINSQLSYVELQDTRWNNLATAMSKKLSEQQKLEEKWEGSSSSGSEAWEEEGKSLVLGGETIKSSGAKGSRACRGTWNGYNQGRFAQVFASKKVPKYDPDKLEEYADLDMEYSTMVAMYDTLKEELTAQRDGLKDTLSTEAQDTHLLS